VRPVCAKRYATRHKANRRAMQRYRDVRERGLRNAMTGHGSPAWRFENNKFPQVSGGVKERRCFRSVNIRVVIGRLACTLKKQCKSYDWSPLLVPKYSIALCATRLPLVQGSIFEPPKSRRTRSNFLFVSSDVCSRRARGLRYIRDSDTLDREVLPDGVCWGGLAFQRKINADRLVQLPRQERKLDCLLPSE
jgi:hypothetical protein